MFKKLRNKIVKGFIKDFIEDLKGKKNAILAKIKELAEKI